MKLKADALSVGFSQLAGGGMYAFLFKKMGEASAMSIVMFAIIMSTPLLQVRLPRGASFT